MAMANEEDLNRSDGWYFPPLPTSSLPAILSLPLHSMDKQQLIHFLMGSEKPVKVNIVRYPSPRILTYPPLLPLRTTVPRSHVLAPLPV